MYIVLICEYLVQIESKYKTSDLILNGSFGSCGCLIAVVIKQMKKKKTSSHRISNLKVKFDY